MVTPVKTDETVAGFTVLGTHDFSLNKSYETEIETRVPLVTIGYSDAEYQNKPWKSIEQTIADGKMPVGQMQGKIYAGWNVFAFEGWYETTTNIGSWIVHSYGFSGTLHIWLDSTGVHYEDIVTTNRIADELTSTNTTLALSANMGRVLNETKVNLRNISYTDTAYNGKPWKCIEQAIADGKMPTGVVNGQIAAGGNIYTYQGIYLGTHGSWIVHNYGAGIIGCIHIYLTSTGVGYKYLLGNTEVVDNLTSTDDTVPLSANQGRVLDTLKVNLRHVGYSDAEYLGKPWKVIENAIARGVMPTGSVCGQLTAGGNLYHYTGYYSGTYGSWLVHNYNAGINSCVQVWATSTGVSYKYLLGTTEVVNNLESTAANLPLSANQGKVINDNLKKCLQIVSFDVDTGTLITKSYDYTE